MVGGLKSGNSHLARVPLLRTLRLYVQGLLYIADQVCSVAPGQVLINERQQDVVDLCEPLIKLTLFIPELEYLLLELPLHLRVVLVGLLDLSADLPLQVIVLPLPVLEGELGLQNPALELTDVLLDLLELPLLGDELLRDEVEVIPTLVLLHHLEHLFQILPKLLVVLTNPQLFLVLVDLRFDPLLGDGERLGHYLVDVIGEYHSAIPQGVAEVLEGDNFGVFHLLAQKVFLPHAELPPLVLIVEVGLIDVGEGLEKLPRILNIVLSEVHDLVF